MKYFGPSISKIRFITILGVSLVTFLMGEGSTYANGKMVITKEDNGKEITIEVSDTIQVELKQYGSTGYQWILEESYKDYLELIREDTHIISKPGIIGGPVLKIWELRAIKEGEIEVRLHLYRVWESKNRSIETFKIKIKII